MKLGNFNLISKRFASHFHMRSLFLLMLLVLLILEFFVVKTSVQIILNPGQDTEPLKATGVRVNFKDYDAVIKHINDGKDYVRPPEVVQNPFSGPAGTGQ